MFRSLKEKLKGFKKKAREDIEKEGGEKKAAEPSGKKESKFLKKVFAKKGRARQNLQDEGPKVNIEGTKGMTLEGSLSDSGLRGDQALRGEGGLGAGKGGLFSRKIGEKALEESLFELEMALLESDVAHPVVERIKAYMAEELMGAKIDRKKDLEDVIEDALKRSIRRVLAMERLDFDSFIENAKKPVVVMFVGVNGTGKTTAIARIAYRLKKKGVSSVLAAGDTFRAGAIEQLTRHSERLGVRIVKHRANADPAAVAYDAIEHAKARKKDVVLLDTAGRMQTNVNLMDEMKKIKRVARPGMIIFVGDSLAGNDAVIQAQKFEEAVGIDGVILTKIDADAKGGAALSIAYTIGKPILFIGTGQEYEDLEVFDPDWMTERIFEE